MRRYLVIVILMCWHLVAMAAISTEVSRTSVQLGEMFRLVFTLDGPQTGSIPDLTPLQENFTIVGTERSTAYNITNGQTHSVNQWIVLLTPKKTGMLFIPSIQIGQHQTTATSIDVKDVATVTLDDEGSAPQQEVMLKTELSQGSVFVNQQLIYTVKLYNSQRLLDAEFIPPSIEDALLIPLGDGARSQIMQNGHGYTVEEQKYAIFPQKSGDLKIVSPTFNAVILDSIPRQINVHAKASSLKVKPIPSSYKGEHWLPARQVALTEIYDDSTLTMKQGSTLVRTITLQAAGIPAELLPPLVFPKSSEYNIYPEKPAVHNTANQQVVIGRADVKVTYLLNKDGRITIPALQVPWFNTDTGSEEMVTLPARTIEVKMVAGAPRQDTPALSSSIKKTQPVLPERPIATVLPRLKLFGSSWWIVIGIGLALMVPFVVWWFLKRLFVKGHGVRAVLKALRRACVENNPGQAQEALLRWARLQWPTIELLNLQQVAKVARDTLLKKQLSLLSQALYSQERNTAWRGGDLWRSVTVYRRTKPAKSYKNSGLPPINPL